MVTLYRKYRSQNFEELVGQEHVVSIIKQAIIEGRLAHAYLFTGPRGTGKTSLARILAKAINCLTPVNGEPCNKCANCEAINSGKYLDLVEIDAASNRGIDEIRSLKESIGFMPVQGKHKVYIIDEVHMLTEPAFNALLKTLEEPPQQVVFILATTEPYKLPLTIISRTQRFDFKLASDENLSTKLGRIIKAEGFAMDAEGMDLVIKAGQGSYRDAETILEKVLAASSKDGKGKNVNKTEVEAILGYVDSQTVNSFLDSLFKADREASLEILNRIYEEGLNPLQFLREVLEAARVKLVAAVKSKSPQLRLWLTIIKELNQASVELKTSLVAVLPIEVAIINITEVGQNEGPLSDTSSRPESKTFTNEVSKNDVSKKAAELKKEELGKNNVVKSLAPKAEAKVVTNTPAELAGFVETINQNWSNFLQEAKKFNHFLTAILTNSSFSYVAGDGVVLKVASGFHKKQLDNPETRKILNKIIASFCGQSVPFNCIIDAGLKVQNAKHSNAKLVEELLL